MGRWRMEVSEQSYHGLYLSYLIDVWLRCKTALDLRPKGKLYHYIYILKLGQCSSRFLIGSLYLGY